jgi:protein-tyrosine phosphatase
MLRGIHGTSLVKKKNIRGKVFIKGIQSFKRSKVALFIFSCVIGTLFAVLTVHWYLVLVPLFFIPYIKEMIFEALVIMHTIEQTSGNFKWYTKVDDDGIYLGAIPILEDHLYTISKKLNINAVLTINEQYELDCTTLVGKPITSDEWKSVGVENLVLHAPDFYPPSFELLIKGSDWINKQVLQHKKVYVHCKSGRGRSASQVAAYLMRYKFMDAHSARATLAMKRPVVFGMKSTQLKNLINFEKWLRNRKE